MNVKLVRNLSILQGGVAVFLAMGIGARLQIWAEDHRINNPALVVGLNLPIIVISIGFMARGIRQIEGARSRAPLMVAFVATLALVGAAVGGAIETWMDQPDIGKAMVVAMGGAGLLAGLGVFGWMMLRPTPTPTAIDGR